MLDVRTARLPPRAVFRAIPRLVILAAWTAAPALAGAPLCTAEGQTTNIYEVLMDVDGDPATGGTVVVEQGGELPHPEDGIDFIARLETGCGPEDSFVAQRQILLEWDGGAFTESTPEEALSYPLGIDLGPMDLDVVEWSVPRSALPGCIERSLFHASLLQSPKNDYTAEFAFGAACGSVLAVPVGDGIWRWLLAGLLGLAGLAAARRLQGGGAGLGVIVAVIGTAVCASALFGLAIMVDGDPADWGAAAPVVLDPADDQSSAFSSEDLQGCYVTEDVGLDRAFFRCDVTNVTDTLIVGL